MTSPAERPFAYQPALDGVRALAVSLVLVFHGGFTWMRGGYVGVSMFFTLSGYLITSLMLHEWDRTARVATGAFYRRRLKRLMPASLLCIAAVVAVAQFGHFSAVPGLRRDVAGALFQVANWTKLGGADSYADLVTRASGQVGPLDHYWSLAIEEQFYWVWPLAFGLLARRARSTWARTAGVIAATLLFAFAAPVIAWRWGSDAAYWATPARLAEILVGASLACLLHRRDLRSRWIGLLAAAALAVVMWAATTWPSGSGPAYSGWLPVFALASAALILGLQAPGPAQAALSAAPLVWLGRISYGVYLFHWPVFALADAERVGADGWGLFAVRVAVTLVIAVASYTLIESPVRRSAWGFAPTASLAAVSVAALLGVAVIVIEPVPDGTQAASRAALDAVAIQPADSLPPLVTGAPATSAPVTTEVAAAGPTATTATPTTIVTPHPNRPVRMLLIGDSTAQATSVGLVDWAMEHPDEAQLSTAVGPGCGVMRGASSTSDPDGVFVASCDELLGPVLDGHLATLHPDLAVVMVTLADVEDRWWSADEGVLTPMDPRYRARLAQAYRELTDRLIAAGVSRVAWVVPPVPDVDWQGDGLAMSDPDRYEVQHQVIAALARDLPEQVRLVELDRWLTSVGGDHDNGWRPDGLHWSPESSRRVADTFLGDALLRAALV